MNTVKYAARLICRLLLGATFVFSGFTKVVDPMGFAYKLQDYFAAFSMSWLNVFAIALAVIISALELFIGLLLLLDELRPFAVWGAAGFMLFFTPLTLYLAIANPVSDCGCFGDALILSNWETFGKNVLLLAASLLLLFGNWRKKLWLFSYRRWRQIALWVCLAILSLTPGIYALVHLPLLDFRPYHIGANLPDAMRIPEDAEMPVYETTFIYEKNGEEKEFTETDYPWDDTTWHFVSSDSKLIAEGYTPPIKDFQIYDQDGNNATDVFLNTYGYAIMAVAPFIDGVSENEIKRLNALYEVAGQESMRMIMLTSSPHELQDEYLQKGLHVPIYTGDERVLKTVIRAEPGIVVLLNGTVIAKWAIRDLPNDAFFERDLLAEVLSMRKERSANAWIASIIIGVFLLRLLLLNVRSRDARIANETEN